MAFTFHCAERRVKGSVETLNMDLQVLLGRSQTEQYEAKAHPDQGNVPTHSYWTQFTGLVNSGAV